MGRPENLNTYVEVLRLLEGLGGSEGHKANEAKFVQGVATDLPKLLPEDDDLLIQMLKHVREPVVIGSPEQKEKGTARHVTFYGFLTTIEQLGGSKGLEDYLIKYPDGIEHVAPVVANTQYKPPRDSESWRKREECSMAIHSFGVYTLYQCFAERSLIAYNAKRWWVGEIDWFPPSMGTLKYDDINNVKLSTSCSLGGVGSLGGGVLGDFYQYINGNWNFVANGFCGGVVVSFVWRDYFGEWTDV
ncbi:hypothetical protein DL96DRAFT_1825999 [Flagelloscypha sp. PMI_526]|nr:hypothetical protein DL96DRAFT_1825999 [Flagelloscypha sp. PMI_526]